MSQVARLVAKAGCHIVEHTDIEIRIDRNKAGFSVPFVVRAPSISHRLARSRPDMFYP